MAIEGQPPLHVLEFAVDLKTEVSVRYNSLRSLRGEVLARGAHEVHVSAEMHGTLPHTPGIRVFRSVPTSCFAASH